MLQDYRTAVCPFIDVVDYNNMEYRAQDEGARGAFDWQLYYKRQVPCVRQERLLCPSASRIHLHVQVLISTFFEYGRYCSVYKVLRLI
jgi:hypothetical protein